MFRRTSVLALAIVVGCSDSTSPAARSITSSKSDQTASPISIRILPNLDGNDVTVTGFNQYDVVTGYRSSPTPQFFRSRTSIEYLTPPAAGFNIGSIFTVPLSVGINAGGKVVGSIVSDTAGRGFIWWHDGGTTLLNPTYAFVDDHGPTTGCGASGINDSGYVVGACINLENYNVAVWRPDLTNIYNGCCGALVAISANGYRTGSDLTNGPPQALVWTPGAAYFTTIGVLDGHPQQSEGLAVNDSGWVAGIGLNPTAAQLWVPGQPVRILSHLGAATGVDDGGNVVGYHQDAATSPQVAFLWNFASGATFLPGLPGGGATAAVAINSNHEILGWAIDQSGLKHAVIWSF